MNDQPQEHIKDKLPKCVAVRPRNAPTINALEEFAARVPRVRRHGFRPHDVRGWRNISAKHIPKMVQESRSWVQERNVVRCLNSDRQS